MTQGKLPEYVTRYGAFEFDTATTEPIGTYHAYNEAAGRYVECSLTLHTTTNGSLYVVAPETAFDVPLWRGPYADVDDARDDARLWCDVLDEPYQLDSKPYKRAQAHTFGYQRDTAIGYYEVEVTVHPDDRIVMSGPHRLTDEERSRCLKIASEIDSALRETP